MLGFRRRERLRVAACRSAWRAKVGGGVAADAFDDLEAMVQGLDRVVGLDRHMVRRHAVMRFGVDRMVDEYVTAYQRIVSAHSASRTK